MFGTLGGSDQAGILDVAWKKWSVGFLRPPAYPKLHLSQIAMG